MNMVDNLTEPMARVTTAAGGSISKLQQMEPMVDFVALAVTPASVVYCATPSSVREEMPLLIS